MLRKHPSNKKFHIHRFLFLTKLLNHRYYNAYKITNNRPKLIIIKNKITDNLFYFFSIYDKINKSKFPCILPESAIHRFLNIILIKIAILSFEFI